MIDVNIERTVILLDNCALTSPEDGEGQISRSEEDCLFDKIIGHIEDLLLGMQLAQNFGLLINKIVCNARQINLPEKEFQSLQQRFLEKYWDVFEPMEDNKLIYTDIFNEYVRSYLNDRNFELPHFSTLSCIFAEQSCGDVHRELSEETYATVHARHPHASIKAIIIIICIVASE